MGCFLVSHRLTNSPGFRRRAEALTGGVAGFNIAYSIVSLLLLAWIIRAYQLAPAVVMWTQEPWMRWVPPIVMLPATLLLTIGMTSPNPFSIGPGSKGFDPARPGILRLTRHPILWGLALWSAAHMVPNGDVAAWMIFAPLLGLAMIGPKLLDAKRRRTRPDWAELAAQTHRPTFSMIIEIGWWKPLLALAIYASLIWLHEPLIGASPLP
ncbi:NnrU family protein [Magnetospirillum sp. 64-120]|uniref:NnrU family protein n=1 Tax=Magnetospirillum sp. 64-120 TaxID=1895778 RepID=UPI000AD78E1D|nr:NnrU family protein [Magnetospirillum sp. 64-120]